MREELKNEMRTKKRKETTCEMAYNEMGKTKTQIKVKLVQDAKRSKENIRKQEPVHQTKFEQENT